MELFEKELEKLEKYLEKPLKDFELLEEEYAVCIQKSLNQCLSQSFYQALKLIEKIPSAIYYIDFENDKELAKTALLTSLNPDIDYINKYKEDSGYIKKILYDFEPNWYMAHHYLFDKEMLSCFCSNEKYDDAIELFLPLFDSNFKNEKEFLVALHSCSYKIKANWLKPYIVALDSDIVTAIRPFVKNEKFSYYFDKDDESFIKEWNNKIESY